MLIETEIKALSKALHNPKRPVVAILGGSKVSDKVGVIESLVEKADYILIGGGMFYTFMKARDYEIGTSLFEESALEVASKILDTTKGKIKLPLDSACNTEFTNKRPSYHFYTSHPKNKMGLDIGPESLIRFDKYIQRAGTII
jgi:phosphoglycerate kinase